MAQTTRTWESGAAGTAGWGGGLKITRTVAKKTRTGTEMERERNNSQSFPALVLPLPVGVVALRNSPGASKRAAGCEDGLAVGESGSVEDNGQLQVVFGEECYLKFFTTTEGIDRGRT